jgi:hypothetical protein
MEERFVGVVSTLPVELYSAVYSIVRAYNVAA